MPLPTTGPISLADIATEFGGNAPHSVSEYYAAAAGVPGSGAINIGVFYGKTAEIAITATSSASLDLSSAFGSDYGNPIAKRLVVPPNVTLGPVSVPPGMAGSLIIENAGEMQGTGGAANGGAGGDAITAHHSFTLLNTGAVRGGGGGGGKGGTGGEGSVSTTQNAREPATGTYFTSPYLEPEPPYYFLIYYAPRYSPRDTVYWGVTYADGEVASGEIFNVWKYNHTFEFEPPIFGQTQDLTIPGPNGFTYYAVSDFYNTPSTYSYLPIYREGPVTTTTYTSGGIGGSGGVGRGYNQSLSAGAAGAAGGTNAGDGGNGGQGGDWGQTGIEGSSGANGNYTNGSTGSAGGAAGRAVRMLAGTLTLSNNGVINGAT